MLVTAFSVFSVVDGQHIEVVDLDAVGVVSMIVAERSVVSPGVHLQVVLKMKVILAQLPKTCC